MRPLIGQCLAGITKACAAAGHAVAPRATSASAGIYLQQAVKAGPAGFVERPMPMERPSILVGKCYRDTFGAVYRVDGYDSKEVRYAVYDFTSRGRLTERHNSDTWADFLADLQSEVECPQPDASTD